MCVRVCVCACVCVPAYVDVCVCTVDFRLLVPSLKNEELN